MDRRTGAILKNGRGRSEDRGHIDKTIKNEVRWPSLDDFEEPSQN